MTDNDFNPRDKFIKVSGSDYLMVRDRWHWARREHPDLSSETELIRLDDTIAVFKCKVWYTDETGTIVQGTGHGSETPQGFPPGYIEKAETIARGRALAAIGYGTDDAFEDQGGKLADAPIPPPFRGQAQEPLTQQRSGPMPINVVEDQVYGTNMANPGQIAGLTQYAKDLDMDLNARVFADYRVGSVMGLTQEQAGEMIMQLGKEREAHMAQDRHEKQRARHQEQTQHLQTASGSAGNDKFTH